MPLYEWCCPDHGVFEGYRTMANCKVPEPCPQCQAMSPRIISRQSIHIIQGGKMLPLGNGSPGKMILGSETGGMDIFIPSYGALEQAEVDYVAEGAIEKERARVKKTKKTPQRESQARLQAYVDLANKTKKGQKAKVLREAIKEYG